MSYNSGVIDKVYVLRWKDPVLTDIDKILLEVKAAHERSGGKVAYFAIADEESNPPDDDTRAAIMKTIDDLREYCHSIVLVLEGRGFRHVLMRSIATGVFLVSGNRTTHIVDSVDAGLTQLGMNDAERQRFVETAQSRSLIRQ